MSLRTAAADPRPSWHHPRILLLLLLVFLTGAAAGMFLMRLSNMSPTPASIANWNKGSRDMTLGWFKSELDITDDQAREIETVLDDYVMFYQNLQGQMDDFRSEGHQRIVKVLTPEQRKKFEKLRGDFTAKLR